MTLPLGRPTAGALALAALATVADASPAAAVATVFFGEDLPPAPLFTNADIARGQFLGRLTPGAAAGNVQDFESFPLGEIGGPPQVLDFSYPGSGDSIIGARITSNTLQAQVSDQTGNARFATSGDQYFSAGQPFLMTFDQGVRAIGFYLTGLGDFGLDSLEVTLSSGLSLAIPYTATDSQDNLDKVSFFGLVSDQDFTSVAFAFAGSTTLDGYGLDDLIVADAGQVLVPAPSALVLGMTGMVGLVALAQRRRR